MTSLVGRRHVTPAGELHPRFLSYRHVAQFLDRTGPRDPSLGSNEVTQKTNPDFREAFAAP